MFCKKCKRDSLILKKIYAKRNESIKFYVCYYCNTEFKLLQKIYNNQIHQREYL